MVTRAAKTGKKQTGIKSPGKLDLKKADKAAERFIRENVDWLKEMAKR